MRKDVKFIQRGQRLLHSTASVLKLITGVPILVFSQMCRLDLHPEKRLILPRHQINSVLLRQ
jgi:hypothetical protein